MEQSAGKGLYRRIGRMLDHVSLRAPWVPLGLISLLCLGVAAAQEPRPAFRSATRLVEVSVTALDGKSRPVTDLVPNDFEISEDGKRREIAFFRFDAAPPPLEPTPPGTYSNRNIRGGGRPMNICALVLDSLNTPPEANANVRAQLMRYLQVMAPETQIAVYRMGAKLDVLHDFTADAESLRARVAKATIGMPLQQMVPIEQLAAEAENLLEWMGGDAYSGNLLERKIEFEMLANAAAQRNRVHQTLAAMLALGRHLSVVPGRKNIIWITAGFSMTSITGKVGFGPRGTIQSYEDQVRQCAQSLAQYGVILYIVDAGQLRGIPELDVTAPPSPALRPGGRGGRFDGQVQTAILSSDPMPAMSMMSRITGGRYLFNSNDLMQGFVQAANDLRGSYTIGFYTVDEPDGRWHSLKVKVGRSGVRLRHREGYIAEVHPPAPPDPGAWRNAALNGLGSSSIPLIAACNNRNPEIEVNIKIDAGALGLRKENGQLVANLLIVFSDHLADGSFLDTTVRGTIRIPDDRLQAAVADGVQYLHRWVPAAGVARTRIVVYDLSTGKYGTLDLPTGRIRGPH